MFNVFAVLHVILCSLLIGIVLLQEGKKGMGAIFGGSSSSIFGARGAGNILSKITYMLAILFMISSVHLAYLSSNSDSVVDKQQTVEQIEAPMEKDESPTEKKEAVSAVKPEEKKVEAEKKAEPEAEEKEVEAEKKVEPKAEEKKPVEKKAEAKEEAKPAEKK